MMMKYVLLVITALVLGSTAHYLHLTDGLPFWIFCGSGLVVWSLGRIEGIRVSGTPEFARLVARNLREREEDDQST